MHLHMSLPQNIILHLGWPNLHLAMELGKDHTYPEVQNGHMLALDKLVPDEEECAQVRSELSQYINEHGVFGTCMQPKIEKGWILSVGGTCMAVVPHICINWR